MVVQLPLEYEDPNPADEPVQMLLMGRAGIGKTTFLLKLPEHLIIAVEPGVKWQKRRAVYPKDWTEFQGYVDAICKQKTSLYQWIGIDTLDRLQDMATDWFCTTNQIDISKFQAHGGGYQKVAAMIRLQALKLAQAGKNVIWTAHTKVHEEANGSKLQKPNVWPTVVEALSQPIEIIALMGLRNEGRQIVRTIYFASTLNLATMDLKDRTSRFPEHIDVFDKDNEYDMAEFLAYLRGGAAFTEESVEPESTETGDDGVAALLAAAKARRATAQAQK